MTAVPSLRAPASTRRSRKENATIVRSLYAAYSGLARGGDVAPYVATHFEPDCEYRPVEEASPIHGHKALTRWIKRWLEAWDDAWDEIDEIIEADETIVAAIRVHGRGRTSGLQISQRLFDVFEFRDGRVLRVREYLRADQALEAAGLRE